MSGRRPVLIMAGGTGGHVFPGLAVAHALREQGVPVVWLGTRNGLEARLVPAADIAVEWLTVRGLRGHGLASWLMAPMRIGRAVTQAIGVLRRLRPGAVLGLGGYVAGPGGLAAWLVRCPLVIHEQNARAGLTNRLLSRLARRVLSGFPGAFQSGRVTEVVGNPVRADILRHADDMPLPGAHDGPLRLLVIGGSLGALALNECVPAAMARLAPEVRPQIRHQAGERTLEQARQAYREQGVEADVSAFIDDMAEAYRWADLVICRAGALTVSELAVVGRPAIFVPLPHAVDDHQTANAAVLVNRGAGWLLPQGEFTPDRLAGLLERVLSQPEELTRMAGLGRAAARPDAAERVARHCLEVQ